MINKTKLIESLNNAITDLLEMEYYTDSKEGRKHIANLEEVRKMLEERRELTEKDMAKMLNVKKVVRRK